MTLPHYPLRLGRRKTAFEFVSIGTEGRITKLIRYSKITDNVYNLAFGDKDITGKISDTVRSNNGDSAIILATVASTVYIFTKQHPEAMIYPRGSTKARTRLYQINICKYMSLVGKEFKIYAQLNGVWEPFKKGINYDGFIVTRKNNNLDI